MNKTEGQIKEIVLKFFSDVDYTYTLEDLYIYDQEERELARGENKGQKIKAWVVSIEDKLFDTVDFLTVADETGEPLYLQTKHTVSEIIKDSEGNYSWKDS